MSRISSALASLLAVFWISPLAQASFPSKIQIGTLWKKTELKVCFANRVADLKGTAVDFKTLPNGKIESFSDLKIVPVPSDLQPLIQKAVSDSFTKEKTGIAFTGWKDCIAGSFDVAIVYNQDFIPDGDVSPRYLAAAEIGKPESFARTSIRLNDSFRRGYYDQGISVTQKDLMDWNYPAATEFEDNWNNFGKYAFIKDVVHEFGHVAGLMHEQERFTLKDLKATDITQDQAYSDEIFEMVDRDRKLEALISMPKTKDFGSLNSLSTMHYFHNDYDLAAEKTRLICATLDRTDLPTWGELHMRGLYKDITHSDGSDFTHEALKKIFCTDTTYLSLLPKTEYENGSLLDHQDQATLKTVYTGASFEDLSAGDKAQWEYIKNHWLILNHIYW